MDKFRINCKFLEANNDASQMLKEMMTARLVAILWLRDATFICTLTFSSPRFTVLNRPRLSLCDLVAQSAE